MVCFNYIFSKDKKVNHKSKLINHNLSHKNIIIIFFPRLCYAEQKLLTPFSMTSIKYDYFHLISQKKEKRQKNILSQSIATFVFFSPLVSVLPCQTQIPAISLFILVHDAENRIWFMEEKLYKADDK